MAYIFVLLAVIGFALQFTLTKAYQARTVTLSTSGKALLERSFYFAMTRSFAVAAIFFVARGFYVEITAFSVGVALGIMVLSLLSTVIGMMVLSRGKMSIYTLFLMLGGMMLPFFVGVIIWDEPLTWLRVLGLGLLTLSLFAPLFEAKDEGKKGGRLFFFLCLCMFFINGMFSILSNFHQITPGHVDAISFTILTSMFTGIGSGLLWVIVKVYARVNGETVESEVTDTPRSKPENRRYTLVNLLIILALALVSGAAFSLQLNSASELDASVLFPMITGGTIFFAAVAGFIFFKEKPKRYSAAGIIIAILATFLFFIG